MASRLSSTIQTLLNKFVATQPALQLPNKPAATSGIPLGDLLASALPKSTSDEATYDFTVNGGTVGAKTLALSLPAGSYVTQVYAFNTTNFTSGGSATIALAFGATALLTATAYNNADFTAPSALLAAPVKVTATSSLTMTVAAAALTAGKYRFVVHYTAP